MVDQIAKAQSGAGDNDTARDLSIIKEAKACHNAIDLQVFKQQLSTLSAHQAIQIPAGILHTLLTSVSNLRQSLAALSNDNRAIRRGVGAPQSYNNTMFVRSLLVPLKIRMVVWDAYLNFPKVICVRSKATYLDNTGSNDHIKGPTCHWSMSVKKLASKSCNEYDLKVTKSKRHIGNP